MQKEIKLIDADISIDDRGELIFCNNFDMTKIKRFYHIANFNSPFVRAYQKKFSNIETLINEN